MQGVSVGPSTVILWIAAILPIVYAVVKAIDEGLDTPAVILAGIGAAMLAINNYNRSEQAKEQIKAEAIKAVAATPTVQGPPGQAGFVETIV